MKYFTRWVVLVAIGVGLAGCASSDFQDTAFNPSSAKVHTIGLLTISPPSQLGVLIHVSSAEITFGAIGEAVSYDIQQSKSVRYTKAVTATHYQVNENLTYALERDLENAGYRVKLIKVDRRPGAFLDSYPEAEGVDAFLDVYFKKNDVGYEATGDMSDYYPRLAIAARLVDASNGQVLYARQTIYRPNGMPIGVNLIQPDSRFSFSGFSQLMSHIKRSIEGMQTAVGKAAQAVVNDIQ